MIKDVIANNARWRSRWHTASPKCLCLRESARNSIPSSRVLWVVDVNVLYHSLPIGKPTNAIVDDRNRSVRQFINFMPGLLTI